MRITKLELHGFKSFPDRTTFHFGGGISAVVGPNGSGKSNVVDALKWCIGEQSARSLRGSEMADVIFAGSADRKPVGFAEVQLSLEADSGEPFPGAYAHLSEVQVGRRLHRNGTSEYLINSVRCRRRDVLDLFLDTGIANDLYSFIEQGQVDKMVSASATERRTLIDEAAGISRYKSKRAEATSRLEATATQLDRVADVLDEMGRRLRTLERQALRAARFRSLRARIRQRELVLSLVKFQELAADRKALRQELHETRATEGGIRRELARRENDLAERREEGAVIDEAVGTWRDTVAEHDARKRELESVRQLSARRREELEGQRARAVEERRAAEQALERLRAEAVEAGAAADRLQAELEAARTSARRAAEAAGQGDAALAELASAEEAAEARLAEAEAARAGVRAERAAVVAEVDAIPARIEQADAEVETAEARLAEARRRVDEREVQVAQQTARAARRQADMTEARRWAEAAARAEEEAEHDHRTALERVRAERARLVEAAREARGRGQAWLDAEERASEARLRVEEQRWQARLEAASQAAEARLEAVRVEAREAAEARVTEVRAAGARAVGAAQHALEEAERRRTDAEHQAETARAERSDLGTELAAAGARRDALERARGTDDRALALVQELEPGATTVLDALPGDLRDRAAEVLGDRVLLPLVRDGATLEALAERLGADERMAVAVWADPEARVAAAAEGDLAAVLDTPVGAELAGPGFRLRADGVVELGTGAVEAVLAERRELAELVEHIGDLEERRAGLVRREAEATQAHAEARAAVQRSREVLLGARAAADEASETARVEADAAARGAFSQAREAAERELATLRESAGRALERARALRGREREEARARLEAATAALEQQTLPDDPSDETLVAVRRRRRRVDVAVGRLGSALADARAAVQRADLQRASEEERVREAEAGVERVRRARTALSERQRALTERGEALEARLADADAAREEAAAHRDEQRHTRMAAEVEARAAGEERSAAAARLSAAEGRLADARAAKQAADGRVRGETERLERLTAEVARLGASMEEAEASRIEAADELEQVAEARAGAWDRLQQERERAERSREGLRQAEEALRELLVRREEIAARVQKLSDRSQQTQGAVEVLRQRMDDRYQVSLPGLLDRLHTRGSLELAPDDEVQAGFELGGKRVEGVPVRRVRPSDLGDVEGIQEDLETLEVDREALARLGEVHLGALAEYRELVVRHDELQTQREDLEESMRSIRSAIAKMNRTCRERFRDAFDRVNGEFQDAYPQLLGGGSARLSLTDEEDLLETGVDIFVQPPGKRLQHLTLLSGGEKAMTAIALLIALFRVKPSPFCVLDEVDAPLDEANGARFNDMLREMSRTSQFVVITHNRKTMECADTLYGVTMARPGVSRLVSVSL